MTAVFCRNTADRKGETWKKQLEPFSALEFAVSDAATGIAKAVAELAGSRHDGASAPAPGHGLDIFHTAMEANRVLAWSWRRAEVTWDQADAAEAKLAAASRKGIDSHGEAQRARAARSKAVAAFERIQQLESAWGRAHAALDLFGPDGRLNDRAYAESEIAAAVRDLPGSDWAAVRNFLNDRRCLAFLDRMHERLEAAEPRRDWREAMAWRWWLRHRRVGPTDPVTDLLRATGRQCPLSAAERASYDRVSAVLRDTFRASSAVECMNSVLRMQQSRHRRMTQPMLDLKRLYWNCHRFGSGPRKDVCPYQALGLELPTYTFWGLLHVGPEELTQKLSTQENTE
jgi:hypothetical protein